jgi:hypothetical protein
VAPPPPPEGLRARLRENAPLRYAAGFAVALSLGYCAQLPYASRQEVRVLRLRDSANKDRYRLDPTVKAQVRALDAEADETAQHAALVTGAIWLLVAAAVFGAWFFLL